MKEKILSKAYVCYTKKEDIRNNSSSGGVFYELAKYAIEERNAVVYGAGFSKEFSVQHMRIEQTSHIDLLMRSKYVQSDMGDTFLKVKDDLKQQRNVLFVGTPCQVKGLLKFLTVSNTDTKNLITVDFICHGVPSPKVWGDYLSKLSLKYKSGIKSVNFRDKSDGWHNFSMKVEFEKSEYVKSHYIDEYMFYYLQDYIMRSSCYKCSVKGFEEKVSDITVADSWKSKRESKKMDKGKSLVIINTQKGSDIFDVISENMKKEETAVPLDSGVIANYQEMLKNKDKFFADYEKLGLSKKLKQKYYSGKALKKNYIKHLLYKIGLANKIG